ncbi:MAG TPA: ATP-binding protein [Salinimicrobium sp.]|nr:ATP-binding protein [Salinimicrobium sp.]
MAKQLKRSYKFAIKTSFFISLVLTFISAIFLLVANAFSVFLLLGYAASTYVFSFFIIQYRVENFIYRHIIKIFDNVSLLDTAVLNPRAVSTDMTSLSAEIEKFAKEKRSEIENLKLRDNFRKEFMGNISHELKTPLFTVQGYILTLQGGAIKDKKVRKKYLNRAAKGVDRLTYIVKDLDMINKLETGELNLKMENFNILEVVHNVFDLLEMKAAKKNISLTTSETEPVFVHADAERIEQVLTNLVVNSIKYGKHDGSTEINIEDFGPSKIIVRVTDNGEGIEKVYIPRLFERFFRVDKSGSRKEGGSGLGLSIVKHILEVHKQKVYVESNFGVGSEFSFTIEKAK